MAAPSRRVRLVVTIGFGLAVLLLGLLDTGDPTRAMFRLPIGILATVGFSACVWWVEHNQECPSPTCDGTLDDAWAWAEALLREHPDWPEAPEAGEHYPL